jgi:replicative superfamily II helicase
MTQDRIEIDALIGGTFFSCQYDTSEIDDHVESALTFLDKGKLIESDSRKQFRATALGERVSRLYVDPETAIMFRDVLLDFCATHQTSLLPTSLGPSLNTMQII